MTHNFRNKLEQLSVRMMTLEFFSLIFKKLGSGAVHQGECQNEIGVISEVPPQTFDPEIRSQQVVDRAHTVD
jgi:hypothetical protein